MNLKTLRKEASMTLQEHATEVERLVRLAYNDLPEKSKTEWH